MNGWQNYNPSHDDRVNISNRNLWKLLRKCNGNNLNVKQGVNWFYYIFTVKFQIFNKSLWRDKDKKNNRVCKYVES